MEKIKSTGAKSVYIWAGFGIWSVRYAIFINGRLNGEIYTELLDEGLIPFIEKHYILNEHILVLEDNTTCPVAKRFKNYNGIEVIGLPRWNSDLKLIYEKTYEYP